MERPRLYTAVAALALLAAPVMADEQAPAGEMSPAPEAPAAMSAPESATPSDAPEGAAPEVPAAAPEAPAAPAESEKPAQPAAQPAPRPLRLVQGTPTTPPPAGEKADGTKEEEPAPAPKKFTFGGQADFYFISNFNNPWNGKNQLRAWDIKDERGPHLGLIELWGEYKRSPIGGRIDVNFGPTARINGSTDFTDDRWLQYFQQLYISANLTKDGRTYLDFGKWVTPIGAELIEPVNNWMYSQGVMFTWPIPFWHFGGRVFHYFNDTDYVMVNVNQGWGTVTQPPGAGTNFGLTASKVFSPRWTVTANYMGGDNFAGFNNPSWRHLFNAVTAYKPSADSKFSFLFDTTLGVQNNFAVAPGAASETAVWYGIQAMTKYQFKDNQYVAGRVEFLNDANGALFGGLGAPGTANGMQVYTLAFNYTRQVMKYLQFRAEYRHDFTSAGRPFAKDVPGAFSNNQGTFTIAAIVSY